MDALRRLEDVTGRPVPAGAEAAAVMLRGPGPVGDETDRHPLLCALADTAEGRIALLVWPGATDEEPLPVVRDDGHRLALLAPSLRDWVRQRAAALDRQGQLDDTLADAVAPHYRRGEAGAADPTAWIVLQGGGSMAAYEALSERQLARGDVTAALVGIERAIARFPGWAEPHARRWRLLSDAGRDELARDAATAALGLPLWTLQSDWTALAAAIGWKAPFDAAPWRRRLDADGVPPLDRAAHLLDATAVAGDAWASIRARVASLYAEGGADKLSRWIARMT